MRIHACAKRGDIEGVARELAAGVDVNVFDWRYEMTPLMLAAESADAGVDMVRFLIENGADVNAVQSRYEHSTLTFAVQSGSLEKVTTLADAGADVQFRGHGLDLIWHAIDPRRPEQSQRLASFLISRGVRPTGVSKYDESVIAKVCRFGPVDMVPMLVEAGGDCNLALRCLCAYGHFHLLPKLFDVGADRDLLGWNDLMFAVALGNIDDLARELAADPDLSARDRWDRTAWLLSVITGSIEKATLLLEAGASRNDRGHFDWGPVHYALGDPTMLAWLIEEGLDVDIADEHGYTPLMRAIQEGHRETVRLLLDAGADVNARRENDYGPLQDAADSGDPALVRLLIEHGADVLIPGELGFYPVYDALDPAVVREFVKAGAEFGEACRKARAAVLGLDHHGFLDCTKDDFDAGRYVRFGRSNPELLNLPFCKAMIRSGVTAYTAREEFIHETYDGQRPVWCYDRLGQSLTELPDGRFVAVGGEHEDFYDSDFCIYNDVVVFKKNGEFDIYGYPIEVFPPTDFHIATLVNDHIFIIGGLRYDGERQYGETLVFRLDCRTFAIESVETSGEKPGWIWSHRAIFDGKSEIRIMGAKICEWRDGKEEVRDLSGSFILNLKNMHWRRETLGR